MRHCVQGQDAQRTIALMEAKIKRLQSIIIRNQPQEEQHLRTIQSLEQVLLCDTCASRNTLGDHCCHSGVLHMATEHTCPESYTLLLGNMA